MQYIHFYICILSFEAIFNESTIAALRHHTETIEWLQTADFLQFFLNLWKILNVKTPFIGTAIILKNELYMRDLYFCY